MAGRLAPWWRRRALGWLAAAAVLAATAAALRGRWEAVGDAGGLPGLAAMGAATALFLVANGVLVAAWRAVVACSGLRLPPRTAAWIWGASQLARYLLGAAQVGSRAVIARRAGVPATTGAVSVLVEVGWQTSLTAAVALATAPRWLGGAGELGWLAAAAIAPVLVLVAGLVAPQRLLRGVGRLLDLGPLPRLTGGRLRDIAGRVRLTRRTAAAITGWFAANTLLRLSGFLLLFDAVGGVLGEDALLAVGAAALGQLVGRVAIFAPGGLGPREGATALAVAPAIGGGPALLLVAATRLAEVVAELVFLGLAWLLRGSPAPTATEVRADG